MLVYDLVRRRFGRAAGFVAGLALATTPIMVAVSRHNNPDALLVLCCVAALWFARARARGRAARAGSCSRGCRVGLGFETKMGVALMVVPGHRRRVAVGGAARAPAGRGAPTARGGAAMVVVGGAWPLLVALTPAADRPWISGTSDNSILSLIVGYNGFGRLNGQTGGPGRRWRRRRSAAGGRRGRRAAAPAQRGLGGQDGWLLGFALVCGAGLLVASRGAARRPPHRLAGRGRRHVPDRSPSRSASPRGSSIRTTSRCWRRSRPRWSAAGRELLDGGLAARIVAPLAVAAGVVTELVVLHDYPGQLGWLPTVLVAAGAGVVLALMLFAATGCASPHLPPRWPC